MSVDYDSQQRESLRRLVAGQPENRAFDPFYSRLVRRLRFAMPLAAVALIAAIFTWNNDKTASFLEIDEKDKRRITGKNELLNPRFEGVDEKGRPYALTALRAAQDQKNEKLVHLEKPKGDIQVEGGHWLAIEANEGAFQQSERKLLLQGGVILFRDGGYQVETAALHIDGAREILWSDQDVRGQGPDGLLSARGLEGKAATETLLFKGPAKLTIFASALGDEAGGLLR